MKSLLVFLTTLVVTREAIAREAEKPLTAEEIRERLEVRGEIFVMDKSGKVLVNAPAAYSNWRANGNAPLESNWGSGGNFGRIHIHHLWKVNDDGSISVLIEEFAREVSEPKSGKFEKFADLLKKSEFTLEDFTPVTWKVLNIKDKNVVVRLTPNLRERLIPADISDLPLAGRDVMVSDNKGFLWNQKSTFNGNYVAFKTHRGTLAVSYRPFKGASQVGEARDNEITVRLPDSLVLTLNSESSFLPAGIGGKVYGIYIPEMKSDNPRSTHIFSSSTEEVILQKLQLQ
jgi:hypothetical protein